MAFRLDHPNSNHYSCSLCVNRKRCFLLLLLTNGFVAALYFTYDLYKHERRSGTSPVNIFSQRPDSVELPTTVPGGVNFIKDTLEKDYDHNDLSLFYQLVEKEFSLGLRCMRKADQPAKPATTTIISNATVNSSNRTTAANMLR